MIVFDTMKFGIVTYKGLDVPNVLTILEEVIPCLYTGYCSKVNDEFTKCIPDSLPPYNLTKSLMRYFPKYITCQYSHPGTDHANICSTHSGEESTYTKSRGLNTHVLWTMVGPGNSAILSDNG